MPNEQQYPTDTENDGVYTNYKYGFRFKYSNEFFKSMFQSNDSVYWRNEEKDIAENESAIELSVLIWEDNGAKYNEQGLDYKTAYIQRFNEFLNIKDGEKVPRGAVRISRYKGADYDRIIYSYTAPPGGESEYKKHYAAWWLKTGYPVIEVRYTAGANNTLERYKPEFDKIIDSFEFITK